MRRLLCLATLAVMLAASVSLAGCGAEGGDGASTLPPQEGLDIGESAPDFRLKNQDQATIALTDYRGLKNVILVFYPLAFTPV